MNAARGSQGAGRRLTLAARTGTGLCACAFALALLLPGCIAADPERIAKEKALAESAERAAFRVYKRPYDVIWKALLGAAKDRELAVVQADPVSGRIELSHGLSGFSAGERIVLRVTRTAQQAVQVEIRSTPVVAFSFPPDWQRLLFGDLEQAVAPRRAR